MAVYESLCQRWMECFDGLNKSERDRLCALLRVEDEVQIRSSVELLLGLGDCGLCYLLTLEGEQLALVEGLCHQLFWKRVILEYVRIEDNVWFGVYEQGYFDRIEFVVLEQVSYRDLCLA